jgi:DNA polymerase III epsilon subunit-like protein
MDELVCQAFIDDIMNFKVSDKIVVVPSIDINICAELPPQYVIMFDTETTGLLPKNMKDINIWKLTEEELTHFPYMTQLSAIVYDIANQKVKEVFNTYIQLPEDVVIPDIVTEITGITREHCNSGIPIKQALTKFNDMWNPSILIAAHNLWFDSKIVKIEFKRNNIYCKLFKNYDNMQCTMIKGMRYFNNRWVKLSHMYEQFFGPLPNAPLHNSLVDAILSLRCYLKIYCNKTMTEQQFNELINII